MSGRGWLRRVAGTGRHADAILCYPHAGAGASAYLNWPALLAGTWDVYAVQPPGRQDRFGEPAATSITGIARTLAQEISRLDRRRVALLGHSLGAVVMLETAHALRAARLPPPAAVIVSGHPSPLGPPTTGTRSSWPDEALLELCGELGADEVAEICQDPAVRPYVLGPLRDDLRMVAAYGWEEREPLESPIHVMRGTEDPATPPGVHLDWGRLTSSHTGVRDFGGGHFFLRSRQREVVAELEQYLSHIGDPADWPPMNTYPAQEEGRAAAGPPDAAAITSVFAEILGMPSYPADLGLGAAGGTSLQAVRIAQRLSAMTDEPVPVMTVLRSGSPAELARAVAGAGRAVTAGVARPVSTAPAVASAADQDRTVERWPLSSPQQRIWLLHERDPERLDHLVTVSLEITGRRLPREAFQRAWSAVIRRHPTLRMRVLDENGGLTAVADGTDAGFRVLDASRFPAQLAESIVSGELDQLRRQPLSLRSGLVARALVAYRCDGTTTVDLVVHHIACDGWSLRVLIDEFFELAIGFADGRRPVLAGPEVTYADFAGWERSAAAGWRARLREGAGDVLPVPEPLSLPRIPKASEDASEVTIVKSASWSSQLRRALGEHAYSPLVVGLAALAVALQRVSGQDAMYLAVPLANRPPDFGEVVGDFVNTSLVRMDLTGVADIGPVLEQAAAQVARVYETQDIPFEALVAHLREITGLTDLQLPRVALTVQNIERHTSEYGDGDLKVAWHEIAERQSKYDLVVTLVPDGDEPGLSLTASPAVCGPESARALLGRVDRALDLVLSHLGG